MGDKDRPWAARLSEEETPNKFTTQLIFSKDQDGVNMWKIYSEPTHMLLYFVFVVPEGK